MGASGGEAAENAEREVEGEVAWGSPEIRRLTIVRVGYRRPEMMRLNMAEVPDMRQGQMIPPGFAQLSMATVPHSRGWGGAQRLKRLRRVVLCPGGWS